jgi:hypothetical protein
VVPVVSVGLEWQAELSRDDAGLSPPRTLAHSDR